MEEGTQVSLRARCCANLLHRRWSAMLKDGCQHRCCNIADGSWKGGDAHDKLLCVTRVEATVVPLQPFYHTIKPNLITAFQWFL
eukprot:5624993-Amphidinium_carterae.2